MATSLRTLNSYSSSSSSNENGSSKIDSADSYLSQLRAKGLTAEEAESISNALFNPANDGTKRSIINESIDVYISMKKRRTETGGESITNPGFYVRSIVRRQLLETGENNNPSSADPKSENQQVETVMQKLNGTPLPSCLQNNDIGPNELNEKCLIALSRCPNSMADNAIKAYARQKLRRKTNGTDGISNPSSYVMAVLRNIIAESPEFNPSSPMDSPENNGLENTSASVIEEESGGLTENTESPPMKRSATSNFFDSETTTPKPQMNQPQNQQTQSTHVTEGRKDNKTDLKLERATMGSVDECLSCLEKLEQPIIQLSGVGPKTESSFHKLGIYTLRDLLWHFPRSFIDRSKLQKSIHDVSDGDVGTFRLKVHADKARHNSVTCTDEAGNNVDVTFFYGRSRQGMAMVSAAMKNLCKEDIYSMIVSGKVKHSDRKVIGLFNPDIVVPSDQVDSLGIEAVYSLSSGLTQKKLIASVEESLVAAGELLSLLPESISDDALEKLRWPKLADALIIAHKPTSMAESGLDSPARQRIAFEELSMQQAQLALSRWKIKYFGISTDLQSKEVFTSWRDSPLVSAAVSSLPFELTPSQMQCLDDMWDDTVVNKSRMLRLLQGDVGSGKTVLAYLLGLGCIEARQGGGKVVSLLCPTQLLAAQHVRTIKEFASRLQGKSTKSQIQSIHVELLTGNVVGKSRDELLARLESISDSDAVFLIGTHALTTPDIVSRLMQLPSVTSRDNKGLALAVVDEEQRFGVRQRQALTSCSAHSLFMSATPIPRSISLKRSGLMDFTLLESESRKVETTIVSSGDLDKVLTVLGSKIDAGSKCFWVLPRIVRSAADGGNNDSNVMDRYKTLKQILGEERVCHIHGRMSEQEREEQLANFADPSSKAAVLVGTTVIEVGIDIPDSNILIVEDADRFGLSQLHQLRGRIGRAGSRQDLKCQCLLLSSTIDVDQDDSNSLTRLQILQKCNRGAEIADADMLLRGPGDMLGYHQSGMKSGFTVDPAIHWGLLEAATKFGRSFLQEPSKKDAVDGMSEDESRRSPPTNDTLENLLAEGKMTSFYDQTSASTSQGLALRIMMALFGEWKNDESNPLEAINTLQKLDASKGELAQHDQSIHAKIVAFCDGSNTFQIANTSSLETSIGLEEQVLPIKPHVAVLNYQEPKEDRLNLLGDDVMFIVLDVETTGLDDKSCHIIQLAAKVLGSDDEDDLFSEYILPPIDRIPKIIEELTGITDSFLREGGYDTALGKERETARDFRQVYNDFEEFCNKRAKGRQLVFVAHNAKFDIKMINGELRRWRLSEHAESAPVLGEIFSSSLDTLQLFRGRKWTSPPRPSSFSLSNLHSHVFNESATNSHNAVGDIKALERLLLSETFNGWQKAANGIHRPFIKVNE